MRIFIWENVLTDYTEGMAVAMDENLESALYQFEDYVASELGRPTTIIDLDEKDPTPFAVHVWGGG